MLSSIKPKQIRKFYKNICLRPHCWTSTLYKHHTRHGHICKKYRNHHHLQQQHCKKKPSWIPPINFDFLQDLDMKSLFRDVHLRHELLLTPNLRIQPNVHYFKQKISDEYWRRVHKAFKKPGSYEFLRVIIDEMRLILVTFINPFSHDPRATIQWYWPSDITRRVVYEALDADLIIQQLRFKHGIANQVEWLKFVFESLIRKDTKCVEVMVQYFQEGQYAKGLQHCFLIMESIKMHIANTVLYHYGKTLVKTCPVFEYRLFIKRPINLDSVSNWLQCAYKRFGRNKDTFYAAFVHLVADDRSAIQALGSWPVTLRIDRKKMTGRFRKEFMQLMKLSLVFIVYVLLKRSSEIHSIKSKKMSRVVKGLPRFWQVWLWNNSTGTSAVYSLIHVRICRQLVHTMRHEKLDDSIKILFLNDEIDALAKKLKLIADLNLQTYGQLYKNISQSI